MILNLIFGIVLSNRQFYKMSLIPNYQLISLQEWEQAAQSACFQTNQEAKEKAQQFFYLFVQSPIINTFLDLINNGSDTLLFVLFTCTSKNTDFFGKNPNNYVILVGNIMNWKLDGFTFIRTGKPPLQQYVTKTIMHTLGVLIKDLYKTEQGQKVIHNCLVHLPNNYFKLYLLRSFIQAVEVIDYQMGYMKYRSLIYQFQDNVIPFICDILLPFFYKIQENIQINELSYLQQQLKVSQSAALQQQFNQKLSLFTRQQEVQANYIFQLLKSVIQFNYNITYTDYELQMTPQHNLITFPTKVLDKIINGQFIKAYFFVLQHITSLIKTNTMMDYLNIGLNCLSIIMQSKLSNLQQNVKQVYIIQVIKGITKIYPKCIQIGTKPIIQAVLTCHNKLLIGCQLSYIKNIVQKFFENQQLYLTYIKDLTSLCVEIVRVQAIIPENYILLKALDTVFKILINFGCRDEENLEQQGPFFIDFQKNIIKSYLSNLCSQNRIFPTNCLNNINQNKIVINQLLEAFKRIAAYDYQFFFTQIQKKIDQFMGNMNEQLIFIANILLLLSEIVDKNFLQRTPFLHKPTSSEIAILARVVTKGTYLLKCYLNTKNVYFKKEGSYIDMAGIFYSEAIINQFLANFQGINTIKIKYILYFHMAYNRSELQQRNFCGDTKSQQTILQYLNILLGFLQGCLIANKQDEAKMLYVLQALQKSIFKLKWNCKRQVYLKSEVFHVLEQFVTKFFNQFHFMVSIRTRTAKMLVTLSFDDALDQYKFRICKFINIVKSQSLISILYDLIGSFQGIQALVICKYFYNKLKKQLNLNVFFNSIFQYAFKEHNQTIFKDSCRLIRVMVNNKGLKDSRSSPISYEMFALVLPNLILITNQIRKGIKDLQFWHDSLSQILEMMNCILNGTHINVYLMENLTQTSNENQNQIPSPMKQFLYSMLQLVRQIVPHEVKQYPKLQLQVLIFYTEINRELLSYIFGDTGEKLVLQFTLFHYKLIDLAVLYMKQLLSGIKTQEDSLIRSLQAARYFYCFAKRNSILIHKTIVLNNLLKVFSAFQNQEVNENKHQIFIFYSLSFILTNYKQQISILKPIGKILYWLSKIFKQTVIDSLVKLKISSFMISQIQSFMINQELSEEGFFDEFRHWVKRCDQY